MQRRRVRFEEPFEGRISSNQITAVERLTDELRNCYDTVDEGRQLLAQLYDKLRKRKFVLNGEDRTAKEDCYLLSQEVEHLRIILQKIAVKREDYIRQLTSAQDIIWSDRKQMENFLRSSRKVERRFQEKVNFLDRFSQEPETLVSELKENSKLLSELLASIQDQLLAEERYIRNQITESSSRDHIRKTGFSVSPRDRRSYIYGRRVDEQAIQAKSSEREVSDGNAIQRTWKREDYPPAVDNSSERRCGGGSATAFATRCPFVDTSESQQSRELHNGIHQDKDFDSFYERYKRRRDLSKHMSTGNDFSQPSAMTCSDDVSLGQDMCDTSSLSKRLKQLVKQSENVQKLIINAGGKNSEVQTNYKEMSDGMRHDCETDATSVKHGTDIGDSDWYTAYKRQRMVEKQPIAEYELPDRLIASPERPGKRSSVGQCESDEERVLGTSPREVREQILHNLDKLDIAERSYLGERNETRGTLQYDQTDHEEIRKELLFCLDKIFAMEKSYGVAEDEIKRLKIDLKRAFREKEIAERVMKTEAAELKEKLSAKTQDIQALTRELCKIRKELDDVKSEGDRTEKTVDNIEVNVAVEDVKLLKEEGQQLKERVDAKSKEVDELKKELEIAIEEMEKMRSHKCGTSNSKEIENFKSEIIILKEENEKLRMKNEDDIAEELAALQEAIMVAEEKQKRLSLENNRLLKENDDWKRILEDYSRDISMEEKVPKTVEEEVSDEKTQSNVKMLQEKMEELQLTIIAKDSEIENLTQTANRRLDESQLNAFMDREEQYQLELHKEKEECKELKKRLQNYEQLLANEGEEIGRKLDDMYENFIKSKEELEKEKEELEKQLVYVKEEYETLLQEYINKLNEFENQRETFENVPHFKDPRKQEVFEAILKTNKTSEQLAELLDNDFVDAKPAQEIGVHAKDIEKVNEELYQKLVRLDDEVIRRHNEVERLKKQNRDLKDELEYVKSEQYIKNKVNQDIVNEKTEAYETLLKQKQVECDMLKEELKKRDRETKERESLSERIEQIYDKFMIANEEEDREKSVGRVKNSQMLEEDLSKRDREIRILKISNRRLKDMLLNENTVESDHLKKLLFWDDTEDVQTAENEALDFDDDEIFGVEEENLKLLRRIKDLNEKLLGFTGVEEDYKIQSKKLRENEKHCQNLEDDNLTLRERLRSLQNEIKELSSVKRARKSGRSTSDDLIKENEQLQERILLMGLDNERLSDDVNELKARLHKSEYETSDLDEQLKAVKKSSDDMRKIQEQKLVMEEKLKELRKKLAMVEKERKELNEEYVKQKIQNEEDSKMFTNEIKKLKAEVISLLGNKKQPPHDLLDTSYDSLPGDEPDGGMHKLDRNKLIKKLQSENHQLSARIISLEDETTATTKIVADMERGHGHLTGILRSHLILQKETTAKLLDNSLKQYSEEFEKVKTKFKGIEDKYDKEKKYSTRRNFAWDLFANAMATITNINAILEEGLIKVDDDLERDFSSDEDFEAKDYKSRLWILRRKLSDVEKRHRELMLRSEELSIRLDAKTTEYDVTQDELEDTIRTLEAKEMALENLRKEMDHCSKENSRLKGILAQLRENQEQTIGAVITENEMLRKDFEMSLQERSMQGEKIAEELEMKLDAAEKSRKEEVNELREKLRNSEKKRREEVIERKKEIEEDIAKNEEEFKKLRSRLAETEKDLKASQRRIAELEDSLKKMEASNALLEEYLQNARSKCRSDGIDHHGTIHMLRDDLKKLFKENEELKKELNSRQKKITSLAADLRKAKIAVKEQIGTDRTLDEQILDRATKDQIMALKRRIKVLEIEKERLQKGIHMRDAYQKGNEERSVTKQNSQSKTSSKKKELSPGLSSGSETKTDSDKRDGRPGRAGDDTEDDLDVSNFSEDLSTGLSQDIELRDKLIQELELRVRELKHELSMKVKVDDNLSSGARAEAGAVISADLQWLQDENDRLNAQLESQERALVPVAARAAGELENQLKEQSMEISLKNEALKLLAKENMDLKRIVGDDLREDTRADYEETQLDENIQNLIDQVKVLMIDSPTQQSPITSSRIPKRTTSKKVEASVPVINANTMSNVEAGVDLASLNLPDTPGSTKEYQGGRTPQFINIDIEVKEEDASLSSVNTQHGRGLSRIPISPRGKRVSKSQGSVADTGDRTTSQEHLQTKVKEQEEDIKTLLQSVEYFEKENENLRKTAGKVDKLQEKLQKSEKEVRSLNTRCSKLRDQLKDSKLHDDKLKDLEDKMKTMITDNKNLEQQIRKSKLQQTEEGRNIAKDREMAKRNAKEMQERLDDLTDKLQEKEMLLQILKTELNVDEFPSDKSVFKKLLTALVDRKVTEKQQLLYNEDKTNENNDLKEKLAQEMSEKRMLVQEIEDLRAELDVALSDGRDEKELFEQSVATVSELESELNELKARNSVLEVTQDVLSSLGSAQQDEGLKSQLETIETEMDILKARNVVLEVIHDVVGTMDERLQEKKVEKDFKNLEAELEGLKARNFVLELTQEVMNELNVKLKNEAEDRESPDSYRNRMLKLETAWEDLKKMLGRLELVDGEGSPLASKMFGTKDEGSWNDSVDLNTVVDEIKGVCEQLESRSRDREDDFSRLSSLEKELENQRKVNNELESKIDDFKSVIKETNAKVEELETEKDDDQEIGHQLVQDQISSLKEKIGKQNAEKVFLEELIDRNERSIDRLTEQVKILEKQLRERESEISQLTQRALESEEDLEFVKNRNEELEDDYQRLLQYGMHSDDGKTKDNDDDENELLIIKMDETIQKLEQDKAELQKKIEDASFTSLIQSSVRMDDFGMENINASQDFERQIERSDEFDNMQATVKRLELEKEESEKRIQDLEKRIEELTFTDGNGRVYLESRDQTLLNEKEILMEKMEETIYRLELDKADLENRVQELLKFESSIKDLDGDRELSGNADKVEEIARMEETIYRLQLDNTELEQRVKELISDDDTVKLKEKLSISEVKISELENELRQLSITNRNMQDSIDDVLASPRSNSSDEEVLEDDGNEIFQGGPRKWKRRLVIAYRELREKSVEIATLRMILAAKNMEATAKSDDDGSSKEIIDHEDARYNAYVLQEEVRMKTVEIAELRDEISTLQNRLQMKSNAEAGAVAFTINGIDGNEIENKELRKEIENLKISLKEKEENYDTLCEQLFGGENIANTETINKMKQEVIELKQEVDLKQMKCDDLENNNDLLYNELVKAKANSEPYTSNEEDSGKQEALKRLEDAVKEHEERYTSLTQDYEELEEKYRKEMNYASTHIGQLMVQVDQLENELKAVKQQIMESKETTTLRSDADEMLAGKLQRTEDELKRKNDLIANLKETVASFYDNSEDISDSLAKELKRLAKENKSLQEQLDLQKQQYELELDSMKTLMSTVKGEHVHSLKDDFERVCNDKIQLQVKLSEIEEKSAKQGMLINELIAKNDVLSSKMKDYKDKNIVDDSEGVVNLGDISL